MEFEAAGRKFNCKEWTLRDLISFNELQTKLQELGAGTPECIGAKQTQAIMLTVDFISSQVSISKDEIMDWPQKTYLEVLNGIVSANNTLPKAPTAAAPSPSSQALPTPTI